MTMLASAPRVVVSSRDRCRVCGSRDVKEFLCLSDMPLTEGFVRADGGGEEFAAPIGVYRCGGCGLCQTQHDVNVADYYDAYAYSSSASPFVQRFMEALAGEVCGRYGLSPGDVVVEVGSGDGAQLGCFQRRGMGVVGFEPSHVLAAEAGRRGVESVVGLFDARSAARLPAGMARAAAALLLYTLDHLPEPLGALQALRGMLDPRRGVVVIEVHDLATIVARREFCLFEHEHTVYCEAATLRGLLARAGLELLELKLLPRAVRRANSLLAVATPAGSDLAAGAPGGVAAGEPLGLEALRAAADDIGESIERVRRYLSDARRDGRRIAGYGAGGRGVMTLAACARPGDVAYLCDANARFHGWLTPRSRVPVVGPEQVAREPVDEVIVFSFGYLDEIRARLTACGYRGLITPLTELI
ncbi:MAG: hypothetical protein CHACPFDD_03036 [Phycisphaerae bacterium]|nr:hypothetical protein [Phycisphaerae bacterium]